MSYSDVNKFLIMGVQREWDGVGQTRRLVLSLRKVEL